MMPMSLQVHPIYGAIYKEGEFVQRGAVLGLSVDSKEVVIAPVSGWVHIVPGTVHEPLSGLHIEIWQQSELNETLSFRPETSN